MLHHFLHTSLNNTYIINASAHWRFGDSHYQDDEHLMNIFLEMEIQSRFCCFLCHKSKKKIYIGCVRKVNYHKFCCYIWMRNVFSHIHPKETTTKQWLTYKVWKLARAATVLFKLVLWSIYQQLTSFKQLTVNMLM